jgi:hypothetical protein
MAIDPPPKDPERERLLALLAFSERREVRANRKVRGAVDDYRKAEAQLKADRAALHAYDAAHPADQPDLFEG